MAVGYQQRTVGFVRLARPRVTMGYVITGLAGLFVGYSGVPGDARGLVSLGAVLAATAGVYVLNDVFDLESDKVDSPDRPIPSGVVSKREAAITSMLLMGVAMVLAGATPISFILCGILIAIGVSYSVPPLRLKRFFFAPNVSLALLASFSFLIGASFGPHFSSRVVFVGLLVLAYVMSVGFAKEFKDVEGDQAAGVKTLPMIVGVDLGAKITVVCLLLAYAFFVIPYFLIDLNVLYPILIILLFAFTAWYSSRFLSSIKDRPSCLKFYDRTLHMSITLFLALIAGSI